MEDVMSFDLEGRTALVTGAGRGIGREIASLLLGAGVARLIAVGRDRRALEALGQFGTVDVIAADLADAGAVGRLIQNLRQNAPELSLLVNNAGAQRLTDFVTEEFEATGSELEREIAVILIAPVLLCNGLLPVLARQKQAAIVNVTTGLVLAPKMSAPVYCATKAGLSAFSRSLRYQCEAGAPHVRIVEALPPVVDTDMTRGRGRGKISAEARAKAIVDGLVRGKDTIDVGKTRLLRLVMRISPAVGYRIMRRG
jgi:uncharacterized oxidoreductase